MSAELSGLQNSVMGLLGGALEVSCFQSLNYFKNASQQNLPLTLNPAKLYRGYPSNLLNMGSCTMWQFVVMGGVTNLMLNGEVRRTTDLETLAAGMTAGMSSGLLGGPLELMMIQQQRKGGSFAVRARDIGAKRMYRGLFATAMREGMWTVGYMSLPPVLRGRLLEAQPDMNPESARVVASVAAALVSCLASHPFDTVKTCMQGDIEGATYKGTASSFRVVYANGGIPAFYRGVHWRYTRQFLAIFLLDKFRSEAAPILFPPENR